MLLTIDIGNTTVAVGGFQGPELRFVRRLPSDRNMDAAVCAARIRTLLAEEGAAPQDVEGAVLSSVVPSLTQVAVQAAEASGLVSQGDLVVVTAGVPVGVSGTTNMIRVQQVGGALLNAVGVGDRKASGPLCVCRVPEEVAEKFHPGDVLVVPYTTNDLLPYIRQAVTNPAYSTEEIAGLLQARCEKLTDIPEKLDFFDALPDYDPELFTNKKSKTNPEVSKAMLEAAIPMLEGLEAWTTEQIHDGLVDLAEKTTREFSLRETELMGEIAIGAGETQSMSFLSRAMVSFRERYPKVTFRIFSATADDVKERLDTGLLDMGLLTEPVDVGRYAFCRMKERDRWGVLVRLDSPLAGLDSVTPDDLEQVPLIISVRERVQRELANWFGDRWERLQIAASFNLILNAANMVRYGVGTALSFDLNFSFDDLRFIPLSPTMDTGTVLVWKKDQVLTPAVEAFHQHIKNVQ